MLFKCKVCKQDKKKDKFRKQKSGTKHGIRYTCKSCDNEMRRNKYANDPIHRLIEKLRVQNTYNTDPIYKAAQNKSSNMYHRKKDLATPPWANQSLILLKYILANQQTEDTGIKHEVDHIVPIRHPLVCGLHWEYNLQILIAANNRRKGNKFE